MHLRGQQFQAGPGMATVLPDFDFETYSEAGYVFSDVENKWKKIVAGQKEGLGIVGARVYAEHPSTEILMLWYDLKDGLGRRQWVPGMPPPADLFAYLAAGGLIEAWNSSFEYEIWTRCAVPKLGWPPIDLFQLRDAAAKSRAHALPGKLEKAGEVINLPLDQRKDPAGDTLINKFSKPKNPTKMKPERRRVHMRDEPIDADRFSRYGEQDIVAESAISTRIPDLPPSELDFWLCDQAINVRGIGIDLPLVKACIQIVQAAQVKYNAELNHLTGGAVPEASKLKRLIEWLAAQGVHTASLDEAALTALLERQDLPWGARRALEIRESLSSAAVKKLYAMLARCSSEQSLHHLIIYHTARTGRAGGSGVQPHNFPGGGPAVWKCEGCERYFGYSPRQRCPHCGAPIMLFKQVEWGHEVAEQVIPLLQTGQLAVVEFYWGPRALAAIAGCLRAMFIPRPGKEFICSDYSAIEAVVSAMLAGEQWRIDVFRTHGKIYEMSASKITGIPFEDFMKYKQEHDAHHPLRKKIGKVAELASGFGGWLNAWLRFGAGEFYGEEEIKKQIVAWREASPNIVEFWGGQFRGLPWNKNKRRELYGLEGAFIAAVMFPGEAFSHGGIVYQMREDVLYCRLLSGRLLTYHRPRLHKAADKYDCEQGFDISYEGWNTNPEMGPMGWVTMWTYGGKLFENVVQATARDVLAHAIVNLERAGYPVVLHVHDEIVVEVTIGTGSVEEVERIMGDLPPFAQGWPIKAANGWRGFRYRKD